MKIENLKYDNEEVTSVIYNGQEVTKLVIPSGDYWEKGSSSEPVFKPLLFMVNSDDKGFFDWEVTKGSRPSYPDFSSVMVGSESFVVHLNECNNIWPVTYTATRHLYCSYIDEHALFILNTYGYNSWPGGTSGGMGGVITIKTSIGETRKLSFEGKADENNAILLRGEVVCKSFRVPAAGMDNYIELYTYPYTFETMYYTGALPEVSLLTIGYQTVNSVPIEESYSDNCIAISIEEGSSIIDFKINYKLEANTSKSYKEFAVIPKLTAFNLYNKKVNTRYMLHFIQEPRNENRIYYGPYFDVDAFDDNYEHAATADKPNYKYHSFFETCSSKIVKTEDDFTVVASMKYFAYCNASDYTVTQVSGSFTTKSSNYTWGDMSYTLLQIGGQGVLRFTRKTS